MPVFSPGIRVLTSVSFALQETRLAAFEEARCRPVDLDSTSQGVATCARGRVRYYFRSLFWLYEQKEQRTLSTTTRLPWMYDVTSTSDIPFALNFNLQQKR
jgi:hypothetical protein